ncbi:MAG: Holliday junction resolvase RuvX [Chloroflexi bacterium]|nr:MAG: Holliday junction resolvase RuvX [Chloroflexota bacterium]
MRIIGLDLGEKRIGVAAADDRTQIAVPLTAVAGGDDQIAAITLLLEAQGADEVVIGLPLSMTGAVGRQAQRALQVVEGLQARLVIPVHTWDERLTTVQAGRSEPARARTGRRSQEEKGRRDAIAAAIMLQAFLDRRRSVTA